MAKAKLKIPPYWEVAKKNLSQDKVMKALIQKYSGEGLKSRGNAFETLARSIVGQQISVKAADSVWRKLIAEIQNADPRVILQAPTVQLRACGLSERKAIYMKDLAHHFHHGILVPEEWHLLSDEEIIETLIQVKGIGRWTAEMFLIFHLLRPDVFPKADLGLHKGLSVAYGTKYPLSDAKFEKFRKQFSPWGSVATWYLWRSLDPIAVEY